MAYLRGTKISYSDTKLYESLGSLIKDYRQWRNLSQETLSGLIGVSVRQLRNWEANRRRARIENLHDLSEVTGIPMQVCVALNADQALWYSLQKRRFAYSSLEAQSLHHDLFKYPEKPGIDPTINCERISTDKHISMVLACHHDIYCTAKSLRRDVIEKASVILPDLNQIIFDSWGHYVGHSIWLPLTTEFYNQLKNQKTLEDYLTPERINNIFALSDGVLLYFSSYTASLNVSHYKLIHAARCFAEIKQKGRFLVANYSALPEENKLLSNMGMMVTGNYNTINSDSCNKLYEVELDALMRPNGPWNWLVEEHERKGKDDLIRLSESDVLSAIKPKKSKTTLSESKKHLTGKLCIDNVLTVDNGSDALTVDKNLFTSTIDKYSNLKKISCPNSKCPFCGIEGKDNIVSNGTYKRKGENNGRRFLCKECGKSFCNRTGTIFYDIRSSEENFLNALKFMAKGMPLRRVTKLLGIEFRTLRHWLNIAARQNTKIDIILINDMKVSPTELATLGLC
ncbi:MAG: helix-turn-helix domain-containing protein [Desulfobacterales bacterium]